MDHAIWKPGDRVRVDGPRLYVRNLEESDLDGDLANWMGSEQRASYVWHPPVSRLEYMRGLIASCDQKNAFIFGIFLQKTDQIVGYRKALIASENGQRSMLPTTVIGDAWAGHHFGIEAGKLLDWFFVDIVGVSLIAPRVYARNHATLALAKRVGYRVVRTVGERSSDGQVHEVVVLHRSAQELRDYLGEEAAQFSATVLG